MGIFKNKSQDGWFYYIKNANDSHYESLKTLRNWLIATDDMIENGTLLQNYTERIFNPDSTLNEDWNYRDNGNIEDFLQLRETAAHILITGVKEVGKPPFSTSSLDLYSIGTINQQCIRELQLGIVYSQAMLIAATIYGIEHGFSVENFEPLLHSKRDVRSLLKVLDSENMHYLQLFHRLDPRARDLITDEDYQAEDMELRRHADATVLLPYQMAQLNEKKEAQSASFLPWIFGESSDYDLSSFSHLFDSSR